MNEKDLKEILRKHKKYLNDEEGGKCADLRYADLRNADLRNANLIDADLRGADLRNADLINANLRSAYLSNVDLRYANLRWADLRNANLRGANLRNADLRDAVVKYIDGTKVISVQIDTSRRNNLINYWVDFDIVTTGCFRGSLEELKKAVKETHKDNEVLRKRYERVIDFIEETVKDYKEN